MSQLAYTLATFCHTHDYTHNYCFCYESAGHMWAAFVPDLTVDEMVALGYMDRSKRGAVLRYKGRTSATIKLCIRRGIKPMDLGSAKAYKAACKAFKAATNLNAGDYFEYVIANLYNITWNGHNSDDARTAGDLVINGVAWQLKANGGNYADESQLLRW